MFKVRSIRRRDVRGAVLACGLIAGSCLVGGSAVSTAAVPQQELPHLKPAMSCGDLQHADVSGAVGATTHITRAEEVSSLGTKPYCQVEGVIDPHIRFELHLPTSGWTQRYLQVGCGGLCGSLQIRLEHAHGCVPVDRGEIAIASTDMGHSGGGGAWAAADPGAKVDFGYRGVHLTALAAKGLIARYYNQAPRYSYFSGCSDGGREALIEAQRFPDDFAGIAAGAPALNFTVQNSFYHGWNAISNTAADGHAILTGDKLPILHAAVVKQCDAADGQQDGLISDPRRCHFDTAVVACKPGQDVSQCLSANQVEVVRKIYDGAHDVQGHRLVISGPMPGSELAWAGVYVPRSAAEPIFSAVIATDSVRYLYSDSPLPPTWSIRDLKFDAATLGSFKLRGLYDATDPDLARFRNQGGKLILWHGWSDPHISPLNSIAYFTAVEHRFGREPTASFVRLFLMPGMYHCSGGEGPFEFDVLTPLMNWVERHEAPSAITAAQLDLPASGPPPTTLPASHAGGESGSGSDASAPKPKTLRSRPVYPYPALATYQGHGDPNDSSSYNASLPPDLPAPVTWLGDGFFAPGYELSCTRGPAAPKCGPATQGGK